MKRILAYSYTGFLLIFICLSLAIRFSLINDYGPFSLQTVMSGSMEPTIPTGSLLLVKQTPLNKIKAGDVITFSQGPSLVTHRATSIGTDYVLTQGDNNNTPDGEPVKKIKGKVLYFLPKVGRWFVIGQTKIGLLAITYTLVAIWLVVEFFEILLNKEH